MPRRAGPQLVFTLALAAVGWVSLAVALGTTGPLPAGASAAGIGMLVAVIVATRAMAFSLVPGAVLSLDSGFYVAAAVTLGPTAAGLMVAVALTADALVRWWRSATADAAARRDGLAYVVYFGGVTGALVMAAAALVTDVAPPRAGDGELVGFLRVLATGVLLLALHNLVQGVRQALGGRPMSRFVREQAAPGIVAELSLLPVAAVAAQLFADGRLLGFGLLAATHLLLNLVFNRLARASAAARARVGELERLYAMATIDGLTGLYVRRYFDARLDEELERARRYGTPFAVAMIDLDDFKGLNDHRGHLAGDRVLREVAAVLRAEVRTTDTPARYGGEELAVILPATELASARAHAERVRRAIGERRVPAGDGGPPLAVTVSIGLAAWDGEPSLTAEELLRRADRALYRAKRAGKDRVELALGEGSGEHPALAAVG